MTRGGGWGAKSEVVETGRCRILELCCSGRGAGGPPVPGPCDTRGAPVGDHGEGFRGMSNEARILFGASSCVFSGLAGDLEGERVDSAVGPELVLDLFSNRDLKDDTGFCQKRIQQRFFRYLLALLTMEASSVPSTVRFTMM